jgi:hypothetical protein
MFLVNLDDAAHRTEPTIWQNNQETHCLGERSGMVDPSYRHYAPRVGIAVYPSFAAELVPYKQLGNTYNCAA